MATIYYYVGMYIQLYANDHAPIHVHGKYQGYESKIEIEYVNGRPIFTLKKVSGKRPLPDSKADDFMTLVKAKHNEIIQINSDWRYKRKKPKSREIRMLR